VKISRWGSDQPVILDAFRDPDGVGWRLDRARFEADLRTNAVKRGANLIVPENISELEQTRQGWNIILASGTKVFARQIIDASGRRSRLLRPFGQRRMTMDRLVCTYQLVPQADTADPSTYTHSTAEGWWYTALLPNHQRIIAFHTDTDLPYAKSTLHAGPVSVSKQIPGLSEAIGLINIAEASKPQICAAGSAAGSAAGLGWLAAGDSALSLDPLSSQGLFNALVTGLEAGETALTRLNSDQDEKAMQAHAERIGRIWQAYANHHSGYYGMEKRWPDTPFWQRRLGAIAAQ
jgi:flavin-dependent dehydrogenase